MATYRFEQKAFVSFSIEAHDERTARARFDEICGRLDVFAEGSGLHPEMPTLSFDDGPADLIEGEPD